MVGGRGMNRVDWRRKKGPEQRGEEFACHLVDLGKGRTTAFAPFLLGEMEF